MPLTLNATLSDQTANSYVDVAYADSYWQGHFNTIKAAQWAALNTSQKTNALIQACRVIETVRFTDTILLDYQIHRHYDRRSHMVIDLNEDQTPIKFYYYQNLQFPRSIDRRIDTGAMFIPEGVQMAQCEQALYLLNFDETVIANRTQGLTEDSVSVGNIRTRQWISQDGSSLAPMALEFLRPFMLRSSTKWRRS